MQEIMIEAQALHRTFGQKEAVKDISFSVTKGKIFGLLGPNGAGKTTTIRMLTGQIDPTSGQGRVAGYDIIRERLQLKQQIGIVFEDQILYERLSAKDNLEFSCQLYGCSKQRVDEVLELVRLRDRAKDPIKDFSNGMRQRVMIARALLHRPTVLFLDEPSRGLDPISARELRNTIQQLCDENNLTVILTTHLMEEADQLCQEVGFVVDGRLVACDTPQKLKLAHGNRMLQVVLANQQSNDDQLEEHLLQMDHPEDQARLSQWMSQGRVLALHSNEATLEEVFIKVAGVQLV